MTSTAVIELYGGPGCGKSTAAAEIYTYLKRKNHDCELVREYVKDWAWEDRKVNLWDELYILGSQLRRESILYNKVQYIITDSPLWLSGFYEKYYFPNLVELPCHQALMALKKEFNGRLYHKRYFLNRKNKNYITPGRYQDIDEATGIDIMMKEYLSASDLKFTLVDHDKILHQVKKDLF